jgi:hypothetical protein
MLKFYKILLSFKIFFLISSPLVYGVEKENSSGSLLESKTSESFQLPKEQSEWFEATYNFLKPVLKTQSGMEKLNELLEMTMPKGGKFDPLNSKRREQTILYTLNSLKGKTGEEQTNFLKELIERHKKYLNLK